MPTKRQIEDAFKAANKLCPGARIQSVGPEGVKFEYLQEANASVNWQGKPFSGATRNET